MKRLLTLLLAVIGPHAAAQPLPASTLHWGELSVTVGERAPSQSVPVSAQIRLGNEVLLTLRDWSVTASLEPLRPGGLPELVLAANSGGAHCCTTYYVFTQDADTPQAGRGQYPRPGALHNLFVLAGGNYGARFVDLNHDGTKEVLLGSDTFAYYDYSFAVSPGVNYVLGWDGARVADLTRRYAWVPKQNARRYQGQLIEALRSGDEQLQKASLVGYFANNVVAGDGAAALENLHDNLFTYTVLKAWFDAHESAILSALYGDPGARLSITDAKSLPEAGHSP